MYEKQSIQLKGNRGMLLCTYVKVGLHMIYIEKRLEEFYRARYMSRPRPNCSIRLTTPLHIPRKAASTEEE